MIPVLFTILNSSSSVKALLGSDPLRVFPWGEAPPAVTRPYATYAVFSGNPQNTLGDVPEVDIDGTQINVWGDTGTSTDAAARAIRDALEPHAHMISYESASRDKETGRYNSLMSFDFFTER